MDRKAATISARAHFDSQSRIMGANHARDSDDSRRVRRRISLEDKAPLKKFSVLVDVDKHCFAPKRGIHRLSAFG
jgi:hypothetical protein